MLPPRLSPPFRFLLCLSASALLASVAVAAPPGTNSRDPAAFDELEEETREEAPPRQRPLDGRAHDRAREDIRREVLEEVRRELDRAREEIREELSYAETEADARAYDAEQLRELRQSVNLLQLHGYFRGRADLFHQLDLKRGVDPSGFTLFPVASGSSYLGTANMRLRLNPVLRVSDAIAIYGQVDVLDNAVAGGSPLAEPFFDPATPAGIFTSRTRANLLNVQRVWAEIETPFGQLAFGRKGLHFGEGMVYNDGNCLDCDYGTTFDRLQFTVGPLFAGHLFTLGVDRLVSGPTTADDPGLSTWGNYGRPFDLQALDDGLRFSLQVSRNAPLQDVRRRLDAGEWVLSYAALGAYRRQHSEAVPGLGLVKVDADAWEIDVWGQLLHGKLRLAAEAAGFFGTLNRRLEGGQAFDQSIELRQGAGVLRGQYGFLRNDSLLVGLDLGIASGDKQPGMGARPGRPVADTSGNPVSGDIDGRQFVCGTSGGCEDNGVSNFRMNPDFRIDQILWRNLFTTVTDAFFVRPEVRFKPGGRRGFGLDDHGFELIGSLVYSQALFKESTPAGDSAALGVEANAAVTYTSRDKFFLGLVYGALFPLGGLNNPLAPQGPQDASMGQIFRAIAGVTF